MPTTRHGRSAPEAIPSGGREQRYSEDLAWTITGAAAIVACADGYTHPAERRSFLAYLRRCGCLTPQASDEGQMFEQHLHGLATTPAATCSALVDRLAHISHTPWAWVALRAAEQVAGADGVVHDSEREAISTIRAALELPAGVPERYPALVALTRLR
ncbi:MAG: TerB family tellurite resistance protein [Rhodopila sp.]